MANYLDILRSVRRTLRDPNPPESPRTTLRYRDDVYRDCITFAINKLNYDLRNVEEFTPLPPWTISTLPTTLSFFITKLAAIQMCEVRASENTEELSTEDAAPADFSRITVPNLDVTESSDGGSSNSDVDGPVYWLNLLDRLQDEYDTEVNRLVPDKAQTLGKIVSRTVSRYNFNTGALSRYVLDRGPSSSVITSITYAAGILKIDWEPSYDDTFYWYKIIHIDPAGAEETLYSEFDNHETSYSETVSLAVGTHSFYIRTGNRNNLTVDGTSSSLVVT